LVGVSGCGRGSGLGSGQHPCRRNEDSVRVATVKERSWFCHGRMRMLRQMRRQLHCTFTPVMEARKQHCVFSGGGPRLGGLPPAGHTHHCGNQADPTAGALCVWMLEWSVGGQADCSS
jgi:hypothetical protein